VVILLVFICIALGLCKVNLTNWIYVQHVSEPESTHTRRSLVLYLFFLLSFALAVGVALCVEQQTA